MSFLERWNSARSACFKRALLAALSPASLLLLRLMPSRHRTIHRNDLSTTSWSQAKTANRSSWVAVRWGSLTRHSTSISDCPVTLKLISERYVSDESAQLRFLREARAAASVRHTNVASILHLRRTGENYFLCDGVRRGRNLERRSSRSRFPC